MIVIFSAALGALYGGLKARKRGGTRLDIAQYCGTYAAIFGLLGLLLTVTILRLAA